MTIQHASAQRLIDLNDGRLSIGQGALIDEDVRLIVQPGGRMHIGERCIIRRGTSIEVSRAHAWFGDDVHIGENVFIYVMCGLVVGSGAALSNMVDIHDHNHRLRTTDLVGSDQWHPCDSGFEAAPVVLGEGAILSNKVTITAGCRIGCNTLVGANAVVTRSLPPNTVCVGVPAAPVKRFVGPTPGQSVAGRSLKVRFVGTSIMEHLTGYSERMSVPGMLAPVGESVVVQSHVNSGWTADLVDHLRLSLRDVHWVADNHSVGGATSRDLVRVVDRLDTPSDLTLVGCGINDVWRRFQGRHDEAVDLDEYAANIRRLLSRLQMLSREVLLVTETPFDPMGSDSTEINSVLGQYVKAAVNIAADLGIRVIDAMEEFILASAGAVADSGLWTDGVHLSRRGDLLLTRLALETIRNEGILHNLSGWPLVGEEQARLVYADVVPRMNAPYVVSRTPVEGADR